MSDYEGSLGYSQLRSPSGTLPLYKPRPNTAGGCGCKRSNGYSSPDYQDVQTSTLYDLSGRAKIRVIDAIPQRLDIDILIDDMNLVSGLKYMNASSYIDIPSGSRTITVIDKPTGNILLELGSLFEPMLTYSLILVGTSDNSNIIILEDSCPTDSNSYVRVIQTANIPAVDVYINEELFVSNLTAEAVDSTYVAVPPEIATLSLKAAGTNNTVLGPNTVFFVAGTAQTIVIAGYVTATDSELGLILLSDNTACVMTNIGY